jgi:hypothetical protein
MGIIGPAAGITLFAPVLGTRRGEPRPPLRKATRFVKLVAWSEKMARSRDADDAARPRKGAISIDDLPQASAEEWAAEDEAPLPDVGARPPGFWAVRALLIGVPVIVLSALATVVYLRADGGRASPGVADVIGRLGGSDDGLTETDTAVAGARTPAITTGTARSGETDRSTATATDAGTDASTASPEATTELAEAADSGPDADGEKRPRTRSRRRTSRSKPAPEPAPEPEPEPERVVPKSPSPPEPKPEPKALTAEQKVIAACRRKDEEGARRALKDVALLKRRALKKRCRAMGVRL